MFLNFGRFFGFGLQSKFDNLIKQENLTLETILNEEEILSELKNQSSGKFADFIIQNPLEYKKMIDYVNAEVEADCQDRNKYIRYPFLISEILGSENEKLINFLFEKPEEQSQEEIQNPLDDQPSEQETQMEDPKANEHELLRANLLEELLKLLERDVILITTAGYFTKIITAIIHKRGFDFWEQLKHYPDIITNMFKHASTRHIVEIFEKLIILDTSQDELQEKVYIEERRFLITRILKYLNGKRHSILIVQNICELFIEVYRRTLLSIETMTVLREILLDVAPPPFFMNLALQTQCSTVYSLLNIQFEFYSRMESLEEGKYQLNFATLYKPVIDDALKALSQNDCFKAVFRTSYGEVITPLGDAKLLFIQLIISLIQRQELQPFLFSGKVFQQIIELVRQHPSNNQLHVLFEKLIFTIMEIKSSHLQQLLFEDTNIFGFLILSNGAEERKKKLGYQGILTKITNLFVSKVSSSEDLSNSLTFISEDWDNYLKTLAEVNDKEQQWILGVDPKNREQQVNVESLSPPLQIPEPLIQYPAFQAHEIRKAESFDAEDPKAQDNQENQIEFEEPQPQMVMNNEVIVENINSDSDKEIAQLQEGQIDIDNNSEQVEEYTVHEVNLTQPEDYPEARQEREILPSPIAVQGAQPFFQEQTNEPESQEKIEKEQECLQQQQQEEQQQQNQEQETGEPDPQEQLQQKEIEKEAEPNEEPLQQQQPTENADKN